MRTPRAEGSVTGHPLTRPFEHSLAYARRTGTFQEGIINSEVRSQWPINGRRFFVEKGNSRSGTARRAIQRPGSFGGLRP